VPDQRESRGYTVAVLGAAALSASLWLPWYSLRIPASAVDSAEQAAHQLGALGPLVTATAQLVRALGPVHATAWQAMSTTPGVLLALAAMGGGLSVLALTGRASSVERMVAGVGIVALLLVGYRLVILPGPGPFVHLAWGIFLALGGAVAILAGAVLAGDKRAERMADVTLPGVPLDIAPSAESAGWSTSRSVPPPSR